jgi:hypothetical protein
MVKPDDVEAVGTRFSPGVDVILRVDQKSLRVGGDVPRRARLNDDPCFSEQHAAALGWGGLAGMGDRGVERGSTHDHRASMAIAMPIPPPMHKPATP